MPCIFCVAVFAMFAGAITTAVLDGMEARLSTVAAGPLTRSVDSASVARFETTVAVPGSRASADRAIPVAVTVYKKHRRVRIQVMTHDLTRAEAQAVEDLVAATLELRIVDRSDAHDEQKVREAFGDHAETTDGDPETTAATGQPARSQAAEPARRGPGTRRTG